MARPKGATENAKGRIMAKAMQLFATKGYAATTMKDIAAAVGIKDASIYNHFKSKRDLFEAVVDEELRYLTEVLQATGAMAHPLDAAFPYQTEEKDSLTAVVLGSFRPLFVDERVICLRRMLESNRYADGRCGELFGEIFIERPVAIESAIFSQLIKAGIFSECDPHFAATEFYGSAFLLLMANKDWKEASVEIEAHLNEFIIRYRRDKVRNDKD